MVRLLHRPRNAAQADAAPGSQPGRGTQGRYSYQGVQPEARRSVASGLEPHRLVGSRQEDVMFEKIIAFAIMGLLFGLVHYRNFYWKGQWEKKTKELR